MYVAGGLFRKLILEKCGLYTAFQVAGKFSESFLKSSQKSMPLSRPLNLVNSSNIWPQKEPEMVSICVNN